MWGLFNLSSVQNCITYDQKQRYLERFQNIEEIWIRLAFGNTLRMGITLVNP